MIRRPAGLLAALLAATSLGMAPPPPAPAPEKPKDVRAEVARALQDSEAARRDGDPSRALTRAREAAELARRSLAAGDPERGRAVRALTRLHCAAAVERGDFASALDAADEAREEALAGGDLKTALDWAGYADDLASRSLEEPDPRRRRAALAAARLRRDGAIQEGRVGEALAPAEQAASLASRSSPAGDPARVRDLLRLAALRHASGKAGEALEAYERAAGEATAHPEGNLEGGVESLIVAAGLRLARGGDDEERAVAGLARASTLLPDGHPFAAVADQLVERHVWGPVAERARGAGVGLEEAEPALRAEVDRLEARLREAGVGPTWIARGKIELARLQFSRQRLEAAGATLDDVAAALQGRDAPSATLGDYWTLRGLLETERANLSQARRAFESAYEVYRRLGHPRQALALNNLGQLLVRAGDYRLARSVLKTAVALYASGGAFADDLGHAFALTNLAKALEGDGEFRDAEDLHRRSLELADRGAGAVREPYARFLALENLGVNLYGAGAFAEAAEEFGKARALAESTFGAEHFRVAEADVNLGWVAMARRRLEEARGRFASALGRFSAALGAEHPRVAEAAGYLARAELAVGRPSDSLGHLREAIARREAFLTRTLRTSLSEYDRLAFVQDLRVHSESSAWPGVLDTYLELAPALGLPAEEQYGHLLAWKGIVERHAPPRADELEDDPAVRAVARRREEALSSLRQAALGGSTSALLLREADVDKLERRLAGISPRFRRGATAAAATPAEVMDALPPRSALLDVVAINRVAPRPEGEPMAADFRYVGFLVRAGRPTVRLEFGGDDEGAGGAAEIDAAVVALRDALEANRPDYTAPAARLGRALRGPLAAHLAGVETLIVVGDGQFHRLPLAALPGAGPGTWWIDELALSTVPSAQSLISRRRAGLPRPAASGALVVGGLDYGPKSNALGFSALKMTGAEAEEVAALYRRTHASPAELIEGAGATLDRLLEALPRHRFAHLATHGFFNGPEMSQPFALRGASARLDSGLALSGANARGPGGLLSAERLGLLDLRGVDLVVLSACQSGLGYVNAGQGTTGLLGALDRAGASAVVAALWRVDDEATASLMGSFYRRLWVERLSPAAALRAAQLDLARRRIVSGAGESFAHPHFWAAFALAGDPAPPERPDEPAATDVPK